MRKQKGTALITALMITTVATAIILLIFIRQAVLVRESQLVFNADNEHFYAQGAIAWAIDSLTNTAQKSLNNTKIPLIDKSPQTMTPSNFQGAKITATLQDQQGLFNINSLQNPNNEQYFVNLLRELEPKMSQNAIIQLAKNVHEWLSTSNADTIYLKKSPPYLAAHQLMANISELRLVEGFNSQLYNKIIPFVTALPTGLFKININSAPQIVFSVLFPNITENQLTGIVACRKEKLFATIDDFNACISRLNLSGENIGNLITTTNSAYFLVTTNISLAKQSLNEKTLLHRIIDTSKKSVNIYTVWQAEG